MKWPIRRNILRSLPLFLAVSSFITLGVNGEVTDECPAFEERKDCVKIKSYDQFRDIIQKDKPEGELVLCPFDVQMASDDKVTWIKTDLHLLCQKMNQCTIRGGEHQVKIHGRNQVTMQGFNFVGATHSAFRVWERTPKLQKVCHCNFESNKGSQKGTSVRLEGPKIFVGHSVFTDNHSDQQGAGLYTYSDACVYKSQFISNTAQRGSGIFVDVKGRLTMKDCDFRKNVANGSGGPAVYVNEGGEYIDGGGNTASENEGGKNCEGVLMKSDCELIFTASDEPAVGESEGKEEEEATHSPTEEINSPTLDTSTDQPTSVPVAPVTDSPTTSQVTPDPSSSPISYAPTVAPVTGSPTASPVTSTARPNATMTGSSDPDQPGKNTLPIIERPTTSTWLSLVNYKREDGALNKCEGDCNKDDDCVAGLLCFRRADNGGWREMVVPGCKASEDHPMKKVDYCYDPLDATVSNIGRGEPDTDTDAVIVKDEQPVTEEKIVEEEEGKEVEPVEKVIEELVEEDDEASTTAKPSATPTTLEPTVKPSAKPTTAEPSALPSTMEPTVKPSASPTTAEPSVSPTTAEPSASPTTAIPSAIPTTLEPTVNPSAKPSPGPSKAPVSEAPVTASPVAVGTESPTTSPTKRPTSEFIDNKAPDDPDGGYFNYDNGSPYGPRKWNKVKPQKTEEYAYWKEFKDAIKEDLDKNYCDSSAQQSPINVFDTGAVCLEYHQIRDRPGDFLQDDVEVEKIIGQNKLRVVWPRRDGDEPDPPGADIPKGWGHIIDAINTDIVIPAEHTINGKHFVGEYRIFHMHKGGKGAAVITALMEIHPLNKRNSHLQQLINEFQKIFDEDMLKCQNKKRREHGLRSLVNRKGANGVSSLRGKNRLVGMEKFPSYRKRKAPHERQLGKAKFDHDDPSDPLTSFGRWDPYDKDLITSLWFYGYEGSLTEPPCTPFLSWRIMDKPMYVSQGQLKQMKNLIFNHIDENCIPTSNQYEGKTARPIQKRKKENEVYRCTCKDFTSDKMRAQSGVYQCSDEQYKTLHPEEFRIANSALRAQTTKKNNKEK